MFYTKQIFLVLEGNCGWGVGVGWGHEDSYFGNWRHAKEPEVKKVKCFIQTKWFQYFREIGVRGMKMAILATEDNAKEPEVKR